jgi:hypothetical protein
MQTFPRHTDVPAFSIPQGIENVSKPEIAFSGLRRSGNAGCIDQSFPNKHL